MTVSSTAGLFLGKRLLIFDLDGTLVDSSPLHARAFSETFAPIGVEVDYSLIAGMVTDQAVDKLLSLAGLELGTADRERLVGEKRRRALELIGAELRPMTGAVEFVSRARSRFNLALCTSASRAATDLALGRVGLGDVFDAVVTAENVHAGKPDPEGFLRALQIADARPSDALVFEDAASGLAAAAAAGIDAVQIAVTANCIATDWPTMLAALDEFEQ